MKAFRTVAALSVVVVLGAGLAFADDAKKAGDKPPMDEKAALEMMQKLATPGEGHKKLDVLVGSWTTRASMWMDPSKPPQVTEGASEQKWVLGGRFLEQRFEGQMMGGPFSGLGYTGYDNYKKRYVSTWMDTAGTTTLVLTGTFDKTGKVLTSSGKMDDPTTGKLCTLRTKATLVGKDEMRWEMWGPGPDGKDYRMMEITYTRKK
jgi:hypothetical protein